MVDNAGSKKRKAGPDDSPDKCHYVLNKQLIRNVRKMMMPYNVIYVVCECMLIVTMFLKNSTKQLTLYPKSTIVCTTAILMIV